MDAKQPIHFRYIFPNLFTAASIFLAVLSIVSASQGFYEKAAWLIVLGTVFDALDGRVARLTNATSKFGAEFDSLADVVSFGMAPAFLLFFAYGHAYGKFGVIVAAIYVIFGAVRLARFNIISTEGDPSVFIGVPIPAAALFVVGWILMFHNYPFLAEYDFILLLSTLGAAILMVSNIRYPSFKKLHLERANYVKVLILLIVALSMLFLFPVVMLCVVATVFLIYGLVRATYTLLSKRIFKRAHHDT